MLAIVILFLKLTFCEETLEFLANQTDQRFKGYIGDDASPEKPTDLLEKFKGKFVLNIIVLRKINSKMITMRLLLTLLLPFIDFFSVSEALLF